MAARIATREGLFRRIGLPVRIGGLSFGVQRDADAVARQ